MQTKKKRVNKIYATHWIQLKWGFTILFSVTRPFQCLQVSRIEELQLLDTKGSPKLKLQVPLCTSSRPLQTLTIERDLKQTTRN